MGSAKRTEERDTSPPSISSKTKSHVDDIRTRIENDFGQENIYKLIYAGKILKDDQTLKSYKINPKQFIVLMITKPQKPIEEEREEKAFVHEDEEIPELNISAETEKPPQAPEIVLDEEYS